jgi:hypothetical protein
MITTPLSGWFRGAGERGTGIAVLIRGFGGRMVHRNQETKRMLEGDNQRADAVAARCHDCRAENL